ncbi:hypothetical protein BJ165DRAFT_1449412 [Panaeolus papilionaceus]|nr:hypothetical protein BJ165DRAFT_1449412 [Panaeolus papilionaceus]
MQSSRNKPYNAEERRNLNAFHGPKKQLLGVKPDLPSPAWKKDASEGSSKSSTTQGGRVFLSNLPTDVSETELQDLFKKTVGALKDCFLVYNSQGKSKGMAVLTFQRPGDAVIARQKYNGKIIDGRRHIKLELLVDQDLPTPAVAAAQRAPSLLNRISPAVAPPQPVHPTAFSVTFPPSRPAKKPIVVSPPIAVLPRRKVKKGPKRLKKRTVTLEDLDKEMEDYRAGAPNLMEGTL